MTNPAVFFTLVALGLGLGGTAIVALLDAIDRRNRPWKEET